MGVASFEDLNSVMFDGNGFTGILTWWGGTSGEFIRLEGVEMSELSNNDFVFDDDPTDRVILNTAETRS